MRIQTFCLVFLFLISVIFPLGANSKYSLPQVSQGRVDEALVKIVLIRFLPSNPFYFTILAKENLSEIIKPSNLKKADFNFVRCGKRLKEAYLLLAKNDVKDASKALLRYEKVCNKMVEKLDKARAQNQDVVTLAAKIEDGLRYQLVLFSVIDRKDIDRNQYNFGDNFEKALYAFSGMVDAVDTIKPGTRSKFF